MLYLSANQRCQTLRGKHYVMHLSHICSSLPALCVWLTVSESLSSHQRPQRSLEVDKNLAVVTAQPTGLLTEQGRHQLLSLSTQERCFKVLLDWVPRACLFSQPARGMAKVAHSNIYCGPSAQGLQLPTSCGCFLQPHAANHLPVR